MAYIGGQKAVHGRITLGCGNREAPRNVELTVHSGAQGFLSDAASFWTRMTRTGAACFGAGKRLAWVSRAACCMSEESSGNEYRGLAAS